MIDPRDLLPGAIEDAPAAQVKTLWDEYAMAALNGFVAGAQGCSVEFDEAAKDCADFADAMMAERERRASKEPSA